jgi:hypothetical protein
MVKRKDPLIDSGKPVLEMQVMSGLTGLPRARDLVDMLKEWYIWYHTYGSLIETVSNADVGKIEELSTRTEDVLKMWGRLDA